MKKRLYRSIALILALFCTVLPAARAEAPGDVISLTALRAFSAENMEALAEALPNATMPYRGSTTIHCLNNTLICRAADGAFGLEGFVQVNNVFPIHWSDVLCIGMSTDALAEALASCFEAGTAAVVCESDGDAERITCRVEGGEHAESFQIVFCTYAGQVYQIEFAFCE